MKENSLSECKKSHLSSSPSPTTTNCVVFVFVKCFKKDELKKCPKLLNLLCLHFQKFQGSYTPRGFRLKISTSLGFCGSLTRRIGKKDFDWLHCAKVCSSKPTIIKENRYKTCLCGVQSVNTTRKFFKMQNLLKFASLLGSSSLSFLRMALYQDKIA